MVWWKGDTHQLAWCASVHWPRSLIILSVLCSDHRLYIPAKHLLRPSVLPDLVQEEMWHDICNHIYKSSWSHRLAVNLKTGLSLLPFRPFIQSSGCVCPSYSARLTQKKTHCLSADKGRLVIPARSTQSKWIFSSSVVSFGHGSILWVALLYS